MVGYGASLEYASGAVTSVPGVAQHVRGLAGSSDHMPENDIGILETLTAKQREVLDLLIEHKSSKEIARELGISPHTVDQRVQFAKEKLGAETRSEAAVEYRRLIQLCQVSTQVALEASGQDTYEESRNAGKAVSRDLTVERNGADLIALEPPKWSKADEKGGTRRIVPEMFEGHHGTLMRLGGIVVTTVLLIFIALGGVAIFDTLSRSLAG